MTEVLDGMDQQVRFMDRTEQRVNDLIARISRNEAALADIRRRIAALEEQRAA